MNKWYKFCSQTCFVQCFNAFQCDTCKIVHGHFILHFPQYLDDLEHVFVYFWSVVFPLLGYVCASLIQLFYQVVSLFLIENSLRSELLPGAWELYQPKTILNKSLACVSLPLHE